MEAKPEQSTVSAPNFRGDGTVPSAAYPRRNLKDVVAAYIRDLVYTGGLRPGVRVDQDVIATKFGSSKLPVREALIVLESEGLIVNYPNRGSFVADLTPADFLDSYLAVGQLSSIAASRAAAKITDDQIALLVKLLDDMAAARTFDEAEASHHEFHRTINLAGGSRRLNRVLRSLGNMIPERLHYASRTDNVELVEEHRQVLEALEGRDPQAAGAAILAHFTSGGRHAVTLLNERGFWDPEPETGDVEDSIASTVRDPRKGVPRS